MPVTIANTEMAEAWEGEADEWIRDADRYDTAGAAAWERFLESCDVGETDRVLDIGCGTGQSARDLARRASRGSVLGVDINQRMLDDARARTERAGITNVDYEFGDAQVHPFAVAAFDLATSRYGAMFFNDRVAAFRNIASAIRPGGRLALLAWQSLDRNPWLVEIRGALAVGRDLPAPPLGGPGPFGLADTDGVRTALADAGYDTVEFEAIEAPMCFGTDADDAWQFFSGMGVFRGLTGGLDDAAKAEAIANLKQLIDDSLTADGVLLDSASWLITARRI